MKRVINKIKGHIKGIKIQTRLFTSSILLICFIIVSLYFLSITLVSGLIIQRQANHELGSFNQVNKFLNSLFAGTEGYIETLYDDENFRMHITDRYDKSDPLITAKYLTSVGDTINTRMINKDYFSKVIVLGRNDFSCVYNQNSAYYETTRLMEDLDFESFMRTSEMSEYAQNYSSPFYYSTGKDKKSETAYDKSIQQLIDNKLIMIRQVKNKDGAADGIVIMIYADNIIENMLPPSPHQRWLYLTSDDGSILWTNDPKGDAKTELFAGILPSAGTQEQHKKVGGENCLVTISPLSSYGFRIASIMPVKSFMNADKKLREYIILFGIFCFIVAFISSWFFSKRACMGIDQLITQFKREDTEVPNKVSISSGRNFYSNSSLRTKLIYHFVISIVLPTILLMSSITYFSYNVYKDKIIDLTNDSVKQLKWNIDYKISEYKAISVQTIFSENVQNVFGNKDYDSHLVALRISEDFLIRKIKSKDIISMNLYDTDGNIVYSNISFDTFPATNITTDFYTLMEHSSDKLIYLGTRKNYLGVGSVMLFGRNIYSTGADFGQLLGYLVFTVDQEAVFGFTDEAELTNSGTFFLEDSFGNIMTNTNASSALDLSGSEFVHTVDTGEGYSPFVQNNQNYLLFYNTLDIPSLKVVGIVPIKEIVSRVYPLLYYEMTILGVYLLIIFVFSALISRSITMPLKTLGGLMDDIKNEKFNVHMNYEGRDEIVVLSESFNHMVDRLNQLIYENYQSKVHESELMFLEKEAQLNALQQQINPHFLYNALESIKWMAYKIDAMNICDMATALGRFFRGAITTSNDFVTFREEIDHLKSYIAIQKVRYQEKLSIVWEVSDDIYTYKTVKLILQPIVENAIIHGIENMSAGGIVTITGYKFKDRVHWEISDNGIGMNPAALTKLNETIKTSDSPSRQDKISIGLKNVYRRLKLYYGDGGQLEISSEEGNGTVVRISIPAEAEGIDSRNEPKA